MQRRQVLTSLAVSALGIAGCLSADQFPQTPTSTCEAGYGVTVKRVNATTSGGSQVERIEYENLSSEQQDIFREIVESEERILYDTPDGLLAFDNSVVRYDGGQYSVSTIYSSSCRN